jgi:hypothetical protein
MTVSFLDTSALVKRYPAASPQYTAPPRTHWQTPPASDLPGSPRRAPAAIARGLS